jgi:poly(hydroxyalkanoate) depolymerase family esterase
MPKHLLCAYFLLQSSLLYSQSENLQYIANFGKNSAGLKMYYYAPPHLKKAAPLVVVLHGCTETAATCADLTGWNTLADRDSFAVLYPEQRFLNNPQRCFNWFYQGNQARGKGEPASIVAMVEFLIQKHNLDSNRVFVTGLSAGAAAAVTLSVTYPDVFSGAAIFAGGAYKSATSVVNAPDVMLGRVTKTPDEWATLARAAFPNYTKNYPKLMIAQGDADIVVSPKNANELIAQFTALHQTDTKADSVFVEFEGNKKIEKQIFCDSTKQNAIIVYYRFRGMNHALPADKRQYLPKGRDAMLYSHEIGFWGTAAAWAFFKNIK